MALEMLLIASSLPSIVVCIPSRTRCKESAISCLTCCCNVIKSAVVAILAYYYATAAAADLEPPSGSTCDGAGSRGATPCSRGACRRVKCNSILWQPSANANALEEWSSAHDNSVTRETQVQECNSVNQVHVRFNKSRAQKKEMRERRC